MSSGKRSQDNLVHGQSVAGMVPLEEAVGGPEELEKVEAAKEQQARQLPDREVERIQEQGGEATEAYLRMGVADQEIVLVSEELGADLVVVRAACAPSRGRKAAGSSACSPWRT